MITAVSIPAMATAKCELVADIAPCVKPVAIPCGASFIDFVNIMTLRGDSGPVFVEINRETGKTYLWHNNARAFYVVFVNDEVSAMIDLRKSAKPAHVGAGGTTAFGM